jgi:hypothetical protein
MPVTNNEQVRRISIVGGSQSEVYVIGPNNRILSNAEVAAYLQYLREQENYYSKDGSSVATNQSNSTQSPKSIW